MAADCSPCCPLAPEAICMAGAGDGWLVTTLSADVRAAGGYVRMVWAEGDMVVVWK